MKLSQEQMESIKYACLDDSTKIIRYLEDANRKQKKSNALTLIFTIIGAVGSLIAAITGIILLFH